ncbi:hypothetical protein A1O3_08001 [Capronia epimyces CBS 606.96]|uniref:Uncharacterized protein n=1 Tax=Capronia epimyces CBS 606.96 TaxID=1182542 RepID=W9XHK1_9EURO|nr:uncharacterized protein A1O3_08001 [Capronia epimyces CBS 606.96]EXJ79718.1 hypothetical protein A1O3_08001 [Capronia epimyces CBS 606.96]
MRAQVLETFKQPYTFRTDILPPPPPEGYEMLDRVLAASSCHVDAVFASGAMQQHLPRVGLHEFAGTVEAKLWARKPPRSPKPQDSLGASWGDEPGCGVWCPRAANLGLTRDGGFQEYCLVDVRQVARVLDSEGARMRAVDVAPLMSIAIIDAAGGLGHLGVQFAAKLGWDVTAVDTTPALVVLKDVVAELGDDGRNVTVVDALNESVENIKKRPFGDAPQGCEGEKACDASLVLPDSQSAFDFGMGVLKSHGTCVCVSFPKDGWRFKPGGLVFRHIKLLGVLTGCNGQLQAMVNFAVENGVRAKVRTYPLEKLNNLVEDYHHGVGGKVVVDMTLES